MEQCHIFACVAMLIGGVAEMGEPVGVNWDQP